MRYAFADCELDTTSRALSRRGNDVHVSPKAYELLCLLIAQRPRVLAKQELMDALWPGTFVVEANLPVLIGELRSAIGQSAARDGVIKTHHGIGYSFVAEVGERRSRPRTTAAERSRASLLVESHHLPLDAGANLVGRDPECDVHLNDPSVSRRHARILVSGSEVTIEDLASKNGTHVNGKRIKAATRVANGDTLTFGTILTTIVIARVEAPSTVTL